MILYTLIVFKIWILRFTLKWKGRFQGVCEKEMVKGEDVERVLKSNCRGFVYFMYVGKGEEWGG